MALVFLQAPAAFEGKRAAWLIDGKTGELLSEFYGPKDSDGGLCSYRGGKFPTAQSTWNHKNGSPSPARSGGPLVAGTPAPRNFRTELVSGTRVRDTIAHGT